MNDSSTYKKKLVVLTGAGISAESGIKTFRDSDGLWEEHDVMQVASPQGWEQDQELVLQFYNNRRKELAQAEPNKAHTGLAELEAYFDVHIITQNIDNLHERGGSHKVLHLHGELTKVRSTMNENYIVDIGYKDILPGDCCPAGGQLRPHVVWFGEGVPAIEEAIRISMDADIFAVIGTSLNVYPAAGLLSYVTLTVPLFIIDPKDVPKPKNRPVRYFQQKAQRGIEMLKNELLKKHI